MDRNKKAPVLLERLRRWARKAEVEIFALLLAYRHPDTPWYAKVVAGLVVAYALSPIDLIPDFVPLLGLLDDLILLPVGVAIAVRLIPSEVLEECRDDARDRQGQRPTSRLVVASLIVVMWLVFLGGAAAFGWSIVG